MLSKTWDLNNDSTGNALTNIIGCYILTIWIKLGFSCCYSPQIVVREFVGVSEGLLVCVCIYVHVCVCRHTCLHVCKHVCVCVCFTGNRMHNSVHLRQALFCRTITPALFIFSFHWGLINCHGYFEYNPCFYYVSLLSSQDCMSRLSDPASLFMVQGLKHCSAITVLTAELVKRLNRNIKICWKIFEELISRKSTLVLTIRSMSNNSYCTFDWDQHQREDRQQEKFSTCPEQNLQQKPVKLTKGFKVFGLELHCQMA